MSDPFRLAEWEALPDVCFIAGCDGQEIDQRGPVWLRDHGIAKACTEHWEPIMRVLGEQATWESASGDAYRPEMPTGDAFIEHYFNPALISTEKPPRGA